MEIQQEPVEISAPRRHFRLTNLPSVRTLSLFLGLLLLCGLVLHWGQLNRYIHYWRTHTVEIDGFVFHLNPRDQFITTTMVTTGTWEPTETSVLRAQLRPGDTYVDVGAYIGYYTVIASKLVGQSGRVIAFEPDPRNFALLKRNVETNGCTNVILEQLALSDRPGSIKLFLHDVSKGSHSIVEFAGAAGTVEVEAVPLDDYLAEWERQIDVVKIDTEGAEAIILDGMRGTFKRYRNARLLMEFYPYKLRRSGREAESLLEELRSLGFRFYNVDEKELEVVPVTAAQLLDQYPPDKPVWTNLFLERSAEKR